MNNNIILQYNNIENVFILIINLIRIIIYDRQINLSSFVLESQAEH